MVVRRWAEAVRRTHSAGVIGERGIRVAAGFPTPPDVRWLIAAAEPVRAGRARGACRPPRRCRTSSRPRTAPSPNRGWPRGRGVTWGCCSTIATVVASAWPRGPLTSRSTSSAAGVGPWSSGRWSRRTPHRRSWRRASAPRVRRPDDVAEDVASRRARHVSTHDRSRCCEVPLVDGTDVAALARASRSSVRTTRSDRGQKHSPAD